MLSGRLGMISLKKRSLVHHWPQDGRQGLSARQASAAMRGFLDALGHDASDFELQLQRESSLGAWLGNGDPRMVAVRRRSTGDQRLYAAGPHSSWLAELLQDLEGGRFGPPMSNG